MLREMALALSMLLFTGCASAPDKNRSGVQSQADADQDRNAGRKHEQNRDGKPSKDLGGEDVSALNDALLSAAKEGKTADVLRHIAGGADANAQDGSDRTPALLATIGNYPETVKTLIEKGADINIQAHNKDNPYLYAGAEGLFDILKLTIEAGADTKLTNRFGGTALIPAAEHAHVDVIEYLLTESDVDVNHVNNLGWTALMEAIVLGSGGKEHQQAVKLLIGNGADVNIPDSHGVTALAHACDRGFEEIANMLEQAGGKEVR
ncbi:ankyrin repeat domain-containing protein [Paenibacillus apiarius]|uniref:Ankyrin repeat domain-containing protein n=1 Tax=Paenibacillus apiarius TaxID=46240 RepID=A0ABT4DUD3_9BACL|nr:ankyrin repeat domain-containing protein [Paenibacillus apiarius]MCY9514499.1 ankyrin repeat domain-containing protein [Paenibacillus apiarius]MCY9520962.1 ankyrin repeat domain-containing protein [Paenibacillus apiarius]MCY9551810.1 ankyrin repeat domain-containing protein [Paenibacillus apiarius]MCY9557697.1 ankyrin repeat domain-containing protein [Paenibacillus apiarius]MCY9684384.1 ankyrin repeat domain-containing protein [Paenibacillus apiarius]